MFQVKMMKIIIIILIIFLAFNISSNIYLFNIQKEIVTEENIKNISKRIMRIQYRHQKEKDIVYFILPEDYACEDIDNYVEEYGNKYDLELRTIFFKYHYVIYEFQNMK